MNRAPVLELIDKNTCKFGRGMNDIPDNSGLVSRFGIPLIMNQSCDFSVRQRRMTSSASSSDLNSKGRENSPFFVNFSRISSEITISVLSRLGPLLLITKNGLYVSVTRLDNQCPKNCASPPSSRHRISPEHVADSLARSGYSTVIDCLLNIFSYQERILGS